MRMFTHWLIPNEKTKSIYGNITNDNWVTEEIDRLKESYTGEAVFIRREQSGMVCIMTDLPKPDWSSLVKMGYNIK